MASRASSSEWKLLNVNCLPDDLDSHTRDNEVDSSHVSGSSIDSEGVTSKVDSASGVTLSNVVVRQFMTGDMMWMELEQVKRCSMLSIWPGQ